MSLILFIILIVFAPAIAYVLIALVFELIMLPMTLIETVCNKLIKLFK